MFATRNSKYFALALLPALLLGVSAGTFAQTAQRSADTAYGTPQDPRLDPRAAAAQTEHTGMWKAVVPPVPMKGEFDNNDPMGLAAGAKIKADCSLNWTDPDTGKLYCFSSGTSLVYFLYAPHTNLARAAKGWISGS